MSTQHDNQQPTPISRNLRRARAHELSVRLKRLAARVDVAIDALKGCNVVAKQHELTLSLVCAMDKHLAEGFATSVDSERERVSR